MNPATMKPRHVLALLGLAAGLGTLRADPGYQGKPFDDAAYRAEQDRESRIPREPYHAFSTARVAWDATAPEGSGWVGKEEPSATLRLDPTDGGGRRVIHYHVALGNYRYAAFGWRWGKDGDRPIDLAAYDAVSFSIRVTGAQRPQELFFGVTELQPAPLSLRDYDPDLTDGSWHRITVPVRAMKWTGPIAARSEVRGFTFMTFVWDPADFDVQLDQFTFDRAIGPAAPAPQEVPEAGAPARGQAIPGRLECAFYDLGGEGVAYHDTTPINILSGVLNQQRRHQRAHATAYHWNFRRDEGVDISFVKDWADLNHPNLVDPPVNQLYIGGTEDWGVVQLHGRREGGGHLRGCCPLRERGHRGTRHPLDRRQARLRLQLPGRHGQHAQMEQGPGRPHHVCARGHPGADPQLQQGLQPGVLRVCEGPIGRAGAALRRASAP